jgi:hypothetical protein
MLEIKETSGRCQQRAYCGEEVALKKGSPARELEPPIAYRLRVFMRWMKKPQEGHWVG